MAVKDGEGIPATPPSRTCHSPLPPAITSHSSPSPVTHYSRRLLLCPRYATSFIADAALCRSAVVCVYCMPSVHHTLFPPCSRAAAYYLPAITYHHAHTCHHRPTPDARALLAILVYAAPRYLRYGAGPTWGPSSAFTPHHTCAHRCLHAHTYLRVFRRFSAYSALTATRAPGAHCCRFCPCTLPTYHRRRRLRHRRAWILLPLFTAATRRVTSPTPTFRLPTGCRTLPAGTIVRARSLDGRSVFLSDLLPTPRVFAGCLTWTSHLSLPQLTTRHFISSHRRTSSGPFAYR